MTVAFRKLILLLSVLAGILPPLAAQSTGVAKGRLQPSVKNESVLEPNGQVHSWALVLEQPHRAVQIDVEQIELDIKVRVVDPAGETRLEGSTGTTGVERIRWVSDQAGSWQVEVFALDSATFGAYHITWRSEQASTPEDRALALLTVRALEAEKARENEEFQQTEVLLKNLLESQREYFGQDNLETALTLHNLAEVQAELGNYQSATTLLQQALSLREDLAPNSLSVALSLNSLAILRVLGGHPLEAEELLQRALLIRKDVLGEESLLVADTLSTLSTLYGRLGRLDQVESLARQALDATERVLGGEHPKVALILNNLGSHYTARNELDEAEAMHRRALAIREKALGARHFSVAESLVNLAIVQSNRGHFESAESLHRQALKIREESLGEDHPLIAVTLSNIGVALYNQGKLDEAETTLRRVVEVRERSQGVNHPEVASSLLNLGSLLNFGRAKYLEAEPLLQRALSIWEERLGSNHPDLARPLNSLAELYRKQGKNRQAEPLLERALRIREMSLGPDHPDVAITLSGLAQLYADLGDYSRAEPAAGRALAIMREALGAEHPNVATLLGNLANMLADRGDTEKALELTKESIAIRQKTLPPEHPDLAGSFSNLATIYRDQKEYQEASPLYERAISIFEKALGPDHPRLATALNNLANLYWLDGQHEKSLPLFQRALAIREARLGTDHHLVALTLRHLASMLFDHQKDDWQQSLDLLDRALEILDSQLFSPQSRIRALIQRARVHKYADHTELAIDDLSEALQSLEELRPQLGGTEETRARHLEQFHDSFFQMVSWQIEAGDIEAAFEYADRAKARALLDQLAAGKVDLRSGIPEDVRLKLEERELEALGLMAEYQEQITRLRDQQELPEAEKVSALAALSVQLRQARLAYKEVYKEIKNNSPLWRDLITVAGSSVSLRSVQRRLIPSDGLLLSYFLGEEESFLFLVPPVGDPPRVLPLQIPPDLATSFEMPEGALGSKKLMQLVSGGGGEVDSASIRNLGNFPQLSSALFQILVPEAFRTDVLQAREVIIIPDGFLHSIPFESLVWGASETDPQDTQYWLDRGPVVRYAPSATTLFNIEGRPTVRLMPGAQNTLLSLSDPVYRPSELTFDTPSPPTSETLSPAQESVQAANAAQARTRLTYERIGGPLRRLPGTARESEAIARAFHSDDSTGASVVLLQGVNASERRLRAALPGKRYIHLATHGLTGDSSQSLFSSLALTPPGVDYSPDNDGFLELYEIYDLKIPECELAVLSACETNVGTVIGREGVFALSRGFLAAGARRVLASQWPVDDQSTAILMQSFFEQIASQDGAGLPVDYSRALRNAKLSLRKRPEYADPYFWAPFILIGKR